MRAIRALRRIRRGMGLTQAELGRRTGICQVSISNFETGSRWGSLEAWIRLEAALGVPKELLWQHERGKPVRRRRRPSIGLRRTRVAGKLSQTELARRSGVSRQTLCYLENGRSKGSPGTWTRLVSALGVPKDLLQQADRMEAP